MHSGETVKIKRRRNKMIKKIANITMSIFMFFSCFTFSGCQEYKTSSEERPSFREEPNQWEFEMGGLLGDNRDEPYDWTSLSFLIEDYPKGVYNLGSYEDPYDIGVYDVGLIITIKGQYRNYRYNPWLKFYYYDKKGERKGPYYGGFDSFHCYYYNDKNATFEEVQSNSYDEDKWMETNFLHRAGWYTARFGFYESEEEYIAIRRDALRWDEMDYFIRLYVKVEDKQIE